MQVRDEKGKGEEESDAEADADAELEPIQTRAGASKGKFSANVSGSYEETNDPIGTTVEPTRVDWRSVSVDDIIASTDLEQQVRGMSGCYVANLTLLFFCSCPLRA